MKKILALLVLFPTLAAILSPSAFAGNTSPLPKQWIGPGKKVIQAIEDKVNRRIRAIQGPKADFNGLFSEPALEAVPMGKNGESLLLVTYEAFKSQGGLNVSIYRLVNMEPVLLLEHDSATKDRVEVLPWRHENALLVHDNMARLYFLRDGKLVALFEYPDTDYEFQGGSSFQTHLTLENGEFVLYRWDGPNPMRITDEPPAVGRDRKAKIRWNDKTGRFELGAYQPTEPWRKEPK